jgi:hypothetical protein
MYIFIEDETYTENFKKVIKSIKKKIIDSTIIVRKVNKDGTHVDILIGNKFLVVS